MSDSTRRRWFQFTLRSLFGVTLLIAAYFAGYVTATKQGARVERVRGMAWCNDLEAAKREAAATKRLILIHFAGKYCQPCRELERTVFPQPHFARAVEEHFVPVKIDVEENEELAKKYEVRRIPCDVVITPQGEMLGQRVGLVSEDKYVTQLRKLALAAKSGVADATPDDASAAADTAEETRAQFHLPSELR